MPQDAGGTFPERQQTAQPPDQRRFAGAVGPEQTKHLTGKDLEADVVHGNKLAEGDRDRAKVDDGIVHGGCVLQSCRGTMAVAAMPDLKMPWGSGTRTLTAKTWCLRSSALWMFRGVNSLTEATWMID